MPDNLNRRGPEDPTKINVNQSYEVSYWTAKLGVSEAVLRRAVDAVGIKVDDVKKWLREKRYIQ
jgi:Protein of unknown function (DUF3606)